MLDVVLMCLLVLQDDLLQQHDFISGCIMVWVGIV